MNSTLRGWIEASVCPISGRFRSAKSRALGLSDWIVDFGLYLCILAVYTASALHAAVADLFLLLIYLSVLPPTSDQTSIVQPILHSSDLTKIYQRHVMS